jgi:DNA-binding NarL/FixJ family response regulator
MPAPFGMLVAAGDISADTPFGSGCAAMGFRRMGVGRGAIMQLSEQERMVARLLVRGYQALNIAALTGISEHTVRTYIRRIYKKLHVSSRADLVRMLLTES